jgi:MYXO-CTERM domain-containing protein
MRADRTLVSLGTLALLLFGAGSAKASYPAGVWVKVQQVELEPDATAPTKVKIHGAAMLYDKSTGTSYPGYSEPALGVLYYECKGDKQTCIDEWTDVQKNIAEPNDVCVGLGDQALPTGTLNPPGSNPTSANTYPIAMGVLEGFLPCQVINQFLLGQADSGAGGSAGSTGSGGSSGSTGSGGSATGGSSSGGTSSGGASSGGASSGGSSSGGASTGGTSSGGDKEAEDDGGCSVSAGTAGGSFVLLALGALGVAAGLRRRRS